MRRPVTLGGMSRVTRRGGGGGARGRHRHDAGGHLFDVTDAISSAQTLVGNDVTGRCRGRLSVGAFCPHTSFLSPLLLFRFTAPPLLFLVCWQLIFTSSGII